jgi:hypothetical protein
VAAALVASGALGSPGPLLQPSRPAPPQVGRVWPCTSSSKEGRKEEEAGDGLKGPADSYRA